MKKNDTRKPHRGIQIIRMLYDFWSLSWDPIQRCRWILWTGYYIVVRPVVLFSLINVEFSICFKNYSQFD